MIFFIPEWLCPELVNMGGGGNGELLKGIVVCVSVVEEEMITRTSPIARVETAATQMLPVKH